MFPIDDFMQFLCISISPTWRWKNSIIKVLSRRLIVFETWMPPKALYSTDSAIKKAFLRRIIILENCSSRIKQNVLQIVGSLPTVISLGYTTAEIRLLNTTEK